MRPNVLHPSRAPLVGREREIALLRERVQEHGRALVVRGDAGVGKSALLTVAADEAREAGLRVLTTSGVRSEIALPYAGLHQLLRPVLADADRLPGPQRDALLGAFGMTDATTTELFFVALAVLNLLSEISAEEPTLLVVDDAQWLDEPSADVIAFLARRLEHEPLVLFAAVRDGWPTVLDELGVDELNLTRLDEDSAGVLLDRSGRDFSPALRERFLREAEGNPLALVELPSGFGDVLYETRLPAWLPLTTRLEETFAGRVSAQPPATRALLLVAALADGAELAELRAATTMLLGAPTAADVTDSAVAARLIDVDEDGVRFHHPLVRSAVYQQATVGQRQAGHAALAAAAGDDDDRRVWHRAAAATAPDAALAAALDALAARAREHGAVELTLQALERAAALSPEREARCERLIAAATVAHESGRREPVVTGFLDDAEALGLTLQQRSRAAFLRQTFVVEPLIVDPGAPAVVALATTVGDPKLAARLLNEAAARNWYFSASEAGGARIVAALDALALPADEQTQLLTVACAAPLQRSAVVLAELRRRPPATLETVDAAADFGFAALAIGAFELALSHSRAAADALRARGRLRVLADTLTRLGWSAVLVGDLRLAGVAAAEGRQLAEELNQPITAMAATLTDGLLAALAGDVAAADAAAAAAERVGQPIGARGIVAPAVLIRGASALAAGLPDEAYDHLLRLFDPADPAYHPVLRFCGLADFAEAALQSDRSGTELIATLERLAVTTPTPMLHAGLAYARCVLASDADHERLYERALRVDLVEWPWLRARLQLARGQHLRRQRQRNESRPPLRAALAAFDAIGAHAWSARCREELRATGEARRRPYYLMVDELTPQELQIAQLAAQGLTNREIGARLYLSHRTIGSHLYRIFPKLEITTRGELAAALGGLAS